MSRQAYEFAFWAIIVVGAGTALLMWQHATHTSYLLDTLNQRLSGAPGANSNNSTITAVALSAIAGPPSQSSPATGVWTPVGPDGNYDDGAPFFYLPEQ
jgi:hypothetical protein